MNRRPRRARTGNTGCRYGVDAAKRPRDSLPERFSMDIKQDPNSIPNFNSGGRIG